MASCQLWLVYPFISVGIKGLTEEKKEIGCPFLWPIDFVSGMTASKESLNLKYE